LGQYLGRGIAGGSLYSSSAHGTEAAKLVSSILTGTAPSSAPLLLETQAIKVLFDWRQMQRWGISEASLPPNSEIRFRDPTLWNQYRWYVIGGLGALAVQAAIIIGLMVERQSESDSHRERAFGVNRP